MNRLILFACLIFGCCVFSMASASSDGLSDAMKAKLTAVSNEMYEEHNSRFLLVDAYRDGYLQFDQSFVFDYSDSAIVINGKRLEPAVEQAYRNRVTAFETNGTRYRRGMFSRFSSDGSNYEKIVDPGSSFRGGIPAGPINSADGAAAIVSELLRDKLVTDSSACAIACTQAALLVNGTRLTGAEEEKYRMLFRILVSFEPLKASDVYVIRH